MLDNAEDVQNAERAAGRARRLKEAQMRKRPMVAGQRKPRRRFEQKSLADFTILRSAPLKKHHVHEVLGKKLAERNRRCEGREQGASWLLAHPKFKQMTIARFWKQFKPLALENIEATRLLQRLRASAASGGGIGGSNEKSGKSGKSRANGGMFGIGGSEQDISVNGGEDRYNRGEDKENAVNVPTAGADSPQTFGVHVVDRSPWLNEHPQHGFMWITRPQFIHHMRILMSLNETHNNLRALNRVFSSFDVDVEDKMNAREFCIVLEILREERKRSVWAGKQDINPIFEEARLKYRSDEKMVGSFHHHM
jgi:hypothetical protein